MVSISSGYTNFSVFKRRLFQLLIFLNVVQVQEGQDVLNRYLLFVFLCDMLVALQMHLVWASGFKSWNKRINLHSILSIFHLNCRYQKWALLFHIEFWFLLFLCLNCGFSLFIVIESIPISFFPGCLHLATQMYYNAGV